MFFMNKNSMEFVIYMIHHCANKFHIPLTTVYKKLKETDCIGGYLVPHYEVLHTQSSEYVIDDIQQYLKKRGVAL